MFSGAEINYTEHRAVLHTALRNPSATPLMVDGENVMASIHAVLAKIQKTVEKIHANKWIGFSGKPINAIVNIGIGGSDLDPRMATAALKPYINDELSFYFVSNVDATDIAETLKHLNPETTLFIVASKTFTTQETLRNTITAREWIEQKATDENAVAKHFIAVTAKPKLAIEFGIDNDNVFPFWDWVGGRYSLWCAIGLSLAIAIGMDNFREFLAGAHAMDEHFHHTPTCRNMPVLLALIGIWNINFLGCPSQAIIPYDQYLSLLPSYMQQLDMESNGKRVHSDGTSTDAETAPVIWGSAGTNGQHAFHQLLMQGTQLIPIDFILPVNSHNPIDQHHLLLVANCLAQSQALMRGKTRQQVVEELQAQKLSEKEINELAPHKIIPGNVPSNTLMIDKITPHSLGALIALYEHKVFTQGVIWGINSFDQWGVELGKQLAKGIIPVLTGEKSAADLDCSTKGLIDYYKKHSQE
jgi:glucose-6-phosphate isomerase